MHEPVTDRVGDGLVTDDGVPVLGIQLTCDDRGPDAIPILEDLEKDLALALSANEGETVGVA